MARISTAQRANLRDWWLSVTAMVITFVLVGGIAVLAIGTDKYGTQVGSIEVSACLRGLIGAIFLFNLYTIYQKLQVHRLRDGLLEREKLFRVITERAAD